MAEPTRYTPGFNYSGWEADHPTEPKPGAELDNDFAHIRHSIDETIRALKDVRRSDGKIQNTAVDFDALSPAVKAAIAGSEFDYEVIEDLLAKDANLNDLPDKDAAVENLGLQDSVGFGSAAEAAMRRIPPQAQTFFVAGRDAPGDGMAAPYVESSAGPDAVQTDDGRWWSPAVLRNYRFYGHRAQVSQAFIPGPITEIMVNGWDLPGDGRGAPYIVGDEEGDGAVQSADGRWWVPVPSYPFIQRGTVTLRVPSDYPDLPTAFASLGDKFVADGTVINVVIEEPLTRGLKLSEGDWSKFRLSSLTGTVPIASNFEPVSATEVHATEHTAVAMAFVACQAPTINFVLDGAGHQDIDDRLYGFVYGNSAVGRSEPNAAGVVNFYCNMEIRQLAHFRGRGFDISGSRYFGLRITNSSRANLTELIANDCCNEAHATDDWVGAVEVTRRSEAYLHGSEILNSGNVGIYVRRNSMVDCQNSTVTGAVRSNLYARQSIIVANYGTYTGGGQADFFINGGGQLNATSADYDIARAYHTGPSLTPNSATSFGMLFDENRFGFQIDSFALASSGSEMTGSRSLALGALRGIASGANSIVTGIDCEATGGRAVAMGTGTRNNVPQSLALGEGSSPSTANRSVHLYGTTGNIEISGSLTQGHNFGDFVELLPNATGQEIPYGTIVTWDYQAKGVRPAQEGDRIKGVVSATGVLQAGGAPFHWHGRYLKDEWGNTLYQEVPDPYWEPEVAVKPTDPEADPADVTWVPNPEPQKMVKVPIENPEYNPDLAEDYQDRLERPAEWTKVGIIGIVLVRVSSEVQPGDSIGPLGTPTEDLTGLECLEIVKPYEADEGYAIARCMVNVRV